MTFLEPERAPSSLPETLSPRGRFRPSGLGLSRRRRSPLDRKRRAAASAQGELGAGAGRRPSHGPLARPRQGPPDGPACQVEGGAGDGGGRGFRGVDTQKPFGTLPECPSLHRDPGRERVSVEQSRSHARSHIAP